MASVFCTYSHALSESSFKVSFTLVSLTQCVHHKKDRVNMNVMKSTLSCTDGDNATTQGKTLRTVQTFGMENLAHRPKKKYKYIGEGKFRHVESETRRRQKVMQLSRRMKFHQNLHNHRRTGCVVLAAFRLFFLVSFALAMRTQAYSSLLMEKKTLFYLLDANFLRNCMPL